MENICSCSMILYYVITTNNTYKSYIYYPFNINNKTYFIYEHILTHTHSLHNLHYIANKTNLFIYCILLKVMYYAITTSNPHPHITSNRYKIHTHYPHSTKNKTYFIQICIITHTYIHSSHIPHYITNKINLFHYYEFLKVLIIITNMGKCVKFYFNANGINVMTLSLKYKIQ